MRTEVRVREQVFVDFVTRERYIHRLWFYTKYGDSRYAEMTTGRSLENGTIREHEERNGDESGTEAKPGGLHKEQGLSLNYRN